MLVGLFMMCNPMQHTARNQPRVKFCRYFLTKNDDKTIPCGFINHLAL